MPARARRRKLVPVVLTVAVWVGLSLMLPIFGSMYSSDFALHDVAASPRDLFTIARPVVLSTKPLIRVDRGTIAAVDQTGKLMALDPATLQSGGAGSGLLLDNAVLTVAASGAAMETSAPDSAEAAAPLVQALSGSRFESLMLRRTTILLDVPGHATEPLTDVRAVAHLKRKGVVSIKGSGLMRGQRLDLDLATQVPLGEARDAGARTPVKVSIRSALLDIQLDGRLGDGAWLDFAGQGEVSLRSVRQIGRWLGAFWSKGSGLRNASARGQVAIKGDTIAFDDATLRMDGNAATGALAVSFSGSRPQLTGTLAYKTFDASVYRAPDRPGETPEPSFWSDLAAGALTVPLGMNLDADLRVSADRVVLGGFELGRSAATVSLKDGRLQADFAEVEVDGGRGTGQIGADFTGYVPRLTLRARLDNADLGQISRLVDGAALAEARGVVIADLSGSGGTIRELLDSVSGRLSVRAAEGGRLPIDLDQLAKAASGPAGVQGWQPAGSGRTAIDRLDLKLVLRDGVILTELAEAAAAQLVWSATGIVNPLTQQIDLRLSQVSAGPHGARSNPPDEGAARPLTIELRGPLAQPTAKRLVEPALGGVPVESGQR